MPDVNRDQELGCRVGAAIPNRPFSLSDSRRSARVAMTQPTRIFAHVDYERDGKQVNWLYLPFSVNRSSRNHK